MGDNIAGPSNLALPPGWTSHISPAGRTYYHNTASGRSTYNFPQPPKQKREKPVSKTLIDGTNGWLRVATNRDNVFYFHPESKRSEWLPPKEVADAVREMEEKERQEKERVKREAEDNERKERERVRREKRERKRKAEEGVMITEFDATAKRSRADEEDADEDEDDDEDLDDAASVASSDGRDCDTQSTAEAPASASTQVAPAAEQDEATAEDDDDDEDWQRQIAEQMAAEAEAEAQASSSPPAPTEAPTSAEEQKAAFVSHLTSLNNTPHEINPMAPWDLEQPKFANHPSFTAFASTRDAEDVFNEWCKLRLREKRAAKAASAASTSTPSNTTSTSTSKHAEEKFKALLRKEVRSTRTKFADFKEVFAGDGAFKGYGRNDGEREKLFKSHLIALGEEKRIAAEKAEKDFLTLLSDKLPGNYRTKVSTAKAAVQGRGKEAEKEAITSVWLEAKRSPGIVQDQRYDAVGSSTRRFELFCSWAKGERRPEHPSSHPSSTHPNSQREAEQKLEANRKAKEKEEAQRRALREREAKVRLERERISRANRSAFHSASREESLLTFRQLLLDGVHSPHSSYHSVAAQLARDSRFDAPGLTEVDKERLFEEHQKRLAAKEGDKLARIFERYAKTLDSHPEDVVALVMHDEDLETGSLKVYRDDLGKLEKAYERWDQDRQEKAKKAFFEMLSESAFVDFWGRLKKEASSSTANDDKSKQGGREEGEEDEDEEGEGVTLVDMARKVDLREIESVLRNDARFRAFRHAPERRERWIREHLEKLAAPRKSVHR